MIALSHPTGNRNVRAVLSALSDAGLLDYFHTTISATTDTYALKFLPQQVRNEWLRRAFPIASSRIIQRPFLEFSRMLFSRLGVNCFTSHEQGWACLDAVYKDLDKASARIMTKRRGKQRLTAVYAYEDGALATFEQAKKMGVTCIYDLPIAYWETTRKLLMEEALRLPAWSPTLGGGVSDSREKLDRKTRELALADLVITPGKFVADSLPPWAAGKPIVQSPFGSPPMNNLPGAPGYIREKNLHAPLRVLFAGSMGQRKGLADLFAAIKLLHTSRIELVVMGSMLVPGTFYRKQLNQFTYEPGRSNPQVLELMRSCDVFCLPSIVEGRALVMQEAMSNGLPVVITPNTGGEDLVREGETGFLVPIRSPEAIASRLAWFLDNRSQVAPMGDMAKTHAARYSWEQYGNTIVNALTGLA